MMTGGLVFLLYVLFLGGIILPHQLQIVFSEARMKEWEMGPVGLLYLVTFVFFATPLLNKKKIVPSDFFLIFQFLVLITPMAALYSASGYIGDANLVISLSILIFPTLVMLVVRNVNVRVPKLSLIESNSVVFFFMMYLIFVICRAQMNSPHSAGFSLVDSYSRRIEGRSIFVAGSLFAYLFSIGTNMITPFFAFWAGIRKKFVFLVVAFFVAVYFYWLLGIKATFLYNIVAYGVGWLVARRQIIKLPHLLLAVVFLLSVVFLMEWRINEYSYVADYFFRRLFSSTVQTQGYYIDLILNNPPPGWDFLFGLNKADFSVTYYVGEHYEGIPLANSNTNAFVVAFGQGGLIGYLCAAFAIPSLFLLLDKIYQSDLNPICLFVGFMFAVLILEQAYTTALLSSGVGFMILLVYFMKPMVVRDFREEGIKIDRV